MKWLEVLLLSPSHPWMGWQHVQHFTRFPWQLRDTVSVRSTQGWELHILDLAASLCCVLGQNSLLSQCLFPVWSTNGCRKIVWKAWLNVGVGGLPHNGLASIILQVVSFYTNEKAVAGWAFWFECKLYLTSLTVTNHVTGCKSKVLWGETVFLTSTTKAWAWTWTFSSGVQVSPGSFSAQAAMKWAKVEVCTQSK